jgi:hypothetical protein
MKRKQHPSAAAQFKKVRHRFERWRKTKKGRERIPDPLWEAAVGLARHYSVNEIAKTLRLNHTELKYRVDGDRGNSSGKATSEPHFVELAFPGEGQAPECVVELERADGAKMRVTLKGRGNVDMATLTKKFWRGEA